jgi:hypothetical protein
MVDSLNEEELNRLLGYLDLSKIKTEDDFWREYEKEFKREYTTERDIETESTSLYWVYGKKTVTIEETYDVPPSKELGNELLKEVEDVKGELH